MMASAANLVVILYLFPEKKVSFLPEKPPQTNDELSGSSWNTQGTFKHGHPSIDLHFTLSQLWEKITEFHKLCTAHFIDFWQVSDSVH